MSWKTHGRAWTHFKMLLKRLLQQFLTKDFSCYERRLYEILRKEAKKRKTKLIVVDKDEVPESYLRKFPYLVFPDNVAIALGVAEAVGVDKETALRGMLNAPPILVRLKSNTLMQIAHEMYLLMHLLLMNLNRQKLF